MGRGQTEAGAQVGEVQDGVGDDTLEEHGDEEEAGKVEEPNHVDEDFTCEQERPDRE